jgi:hypothetical protein
MASKIVVVCFIGAMAAAAAPNDREFRVTLIHPKTFLIRVLIKTV